MKHWLRKQTWVTRILNIFLTIYFVDLNLMTKKKKTRILLKYIIYNIKHNSFKLTIMFLLRFTTFSTNIFSTFPTFILHTNGSQIVSTYIKIQFPTRLSVKRYVDNLKYNYIFHFLDHDALKKKKKKTFHAVIVRG